MELSPAHINALLTAAGQVNFNPLSSEWATIGQPLREACEILAAAAQQHTQEQAGEAPD